MSTGPDDDGRDGRDGSLADAGAPITILLQRWAEGDVDALAQVTDRLYTELRVVAAAYLRRERSSHTLQPTALIHEAYLRLHVTDPVGFANRRQFFGLTAKVMRQVLVDHARRLHRHKRGSGAAADTLPEGLADGLPPVDTLVILDEALTKLAALNDRQARVIELRYFGGFSQDEVGDILGVSTPTVSRDQRMAEAWLNQLLSDGHA